MTTEPSNGTASDDQRCYIERLEADVESWQAWKRNVADVVLKHRADEIERLERIEQVARAFLEAEATA